MGSTWQITGWPIIVAQLGATSGAPACPPCQLTYEILYNKPPPSPMGTISHGDALRCLVRCVMLLSEEHAI